MGILAFYMTKTRESLIETLSNHPDYIKFSKADLLEAGLHLLHIQTLRPEELKKKSGFDIVELEKMYLAPMTRESFAELDKVIMDLNRVHNKKFREDIWI